jgi:predicted dehydrogenase
MVRFNYEYERKLKVGYLGCGGHSFRNIFPCFQFAPLDLVGVCDLQEARAAAFARQFGARKHYTDYPAMLAEERPEAVFIVTGYDADGRPTYPQLAEQALRAGAHVWIEKPPAASAGEIRRLMEVERETERFVMVGFKKMFFPAIARAREIIGSEGFGGLSSISVRYPESLPPAEKRGDDRAMRGFLDHLSHPGAILYTLGGPIESLFFQREPRNGASIANLRFRSGAIGCLYQSAGRSGAAPLERVEAIGRGENLVVENGCHLTYYRRGGRGEGGYGRAASFMGPDETAPIVWEPEFSLGQLYNKGLFLLGYAPEVLHFCETALAAIDDPTGGHRPQHADLRAALEITKLYEAFRGDEGRVIRLDET